MYGWVVAEDFLHQLYWVALVKFINKHGPEHAWLKQDNQKLYLAPSWSWLSCDEPVCYDHSPFKPTARLVSCFVEPVDRSSRLGRLKGGKLVLDTEFLHSRRDFAPYKLQFDDSAFKDLDSIILIKLGCQGWNVVGLILIPANRNDPNRSDNDLQ